MKPITLTPMLKRYIVNFLLRISIFIAILLTYLADRKTLIRLTTQPIVSGVNLLHLLWVLLMGIMVTHLIPLKTLAMGARKSRKETYVQNEGYSDYHLLQYVQRQNTRAWDVMLLWLCFNAFFGLLYLFHIIGDAELILLTCFYFLSDYICILLFCPFQTLIMKNKCCVNCRIYDWGHFMMFTPMLFIRNFFSWSLFFMSVVVLIHWEMIYAKHPERFWEGSNKILQCRHCKDKSCQLKNNLKRATKKMGAH